MAEHIELHFQEGFSGEAVEVQVTGKAAAHFVARTKVQTGLAHIQKLELADGTTVRITVPATGAEASVKVSKASPHIAVNLVNKKLDIEAKKESPGYL